MKNQIAKSSAIVLALVLGMACTRSASAQDCEAFYTNSSDVQVTLAEQWNGKSWTIQSTGNAAGANHLLGISCSSASACTAIGIYQDSKSLGTLAERWGPR